MSRARSNNEQHVSPGNQPWGAPRIYEELSNSANTRCPQTGRVEVLGLPNVPPANHCSLLECAIKPFERLSPPGVCQEPESRELLA
jgi:hypothetical protein